MSNKKFRKAALFFLSIALILIVSGVLYFFLATESPSQTKASSFREGATDTFVGNLGGVPVSIPKEYAHFLEYDGDPGFGKKRSISQSDRTFESKIGGFAFQVSFPGLEPFWGKPQGWSKEKISSSLSVGVNSNSDYYGSDFLDKYVEDLLRDGSSKYRYRLTGKVLHELTELTPIGANETLRSAAVGDVSDNNFYFYRDAAGDVIALIECSNMENVRATCKQWFDADKKLKTTIWVRYPRALLSEWRAIMARVNEIVASFESK